MLGGDAGPPVTIVGHWTFPCGELLLVNPHLHVQCTPPNRPVPWVSVRRCSSTTIVTRSYSTRSAAAGGIPPVQRCAPWPLARICFLERHMSFLPSKRVTLSIRSWTLVLLPGRCSPSDRAEACGSGAAAYPAPHRIGTTLCRGRVGFSSYPSCLISPRQSGSVLGTEAAAAPVLLRSRTRSAAAVWEGSLGRSLHHDTPQPRLL